MGQIRILEGIARGETLTNTLAAIRQYVEQQVEQTTASMHLTSAAAWLPARESRIAMPIRSAGDSIVGMLVLHRPGQHPLSAQEREAVATAVRMAGLAIERHEADTLLRHKALHDPLTGLPNRLLLQDRLERGLLSKRTAEAQVALLFLDLDDFKQINDRYGHLAGDEVLSQVGRRLLTCIRPRDTAARLGGDEFTVLLEEIQTQADAEVVARRIMDQFQAPFTVAGHKIVIRCSLGLTLGRCAVDTPEALLHRADLAMYQAKQEGKGQMAVAEASPKTILVKREPSISRRVLVPMLVRS